MASGVDTCYYWQSNPVTQNPSARSRWQAEWIRAITGNRIQGLIGHLQEADGKRSGYVLLLAIKSSDSKPICKKPMASGVDTCYYWQSNPVTQNPSARSRWQAERIRAITDNQIQRLREELHLCKKPMASEVDQCNITRVPLRNPSLPSLPVRSPLSCRASSTRAGKYSSDSRLPCTRASALREAGSYP